MENVLVKYQGNGLLRYDGKEYFESKSKLRRDKNARGPLKNGEQVTITTKTRISKAVVVMYINYQKKGETGKEYTQYDAVFDLEAAEDAWPNFKTFFERFKDNPALGPGSVEDSAMPQSSTIAREEVAEPERVNDTPSGSRCPSRHSIRSVSGDSDSEEEGDEIPIPTKKAKEEETRVGKKKGKQTGAVPS